MQEKNFLKKTVICAVVQFSSWNFHPDMAAALPKRHLVAVTQ